MNERKNQVLCEIGNGQVIRDWMCEVFFRKAGIQLISGGEVIKAADATLRGEDYLVNERSFALGLPSGTLELLELIKIDKYENYLASLGEGVKTDAKPSHSKTIGLC